ncbi:MAG: hypothetical protein ACRDYY_17720 [Acidimicrobiales bacterium]
MQTGSSYLVALDQGDRHAKAGGAQGGAVAAGPAADHDDVIVLFGLLLDHGTSWGSVVTKFFAAQ